jgi:hypothetical protein
VKEGLSLLVVRSRIKKLQESVAVLKRVPIPAPDIRQKVQSYVAGLTRPIIGGVDAGEVLTVQGLRACTYSSLFFSRRFWLSGSWPRSIESRIRRFLWPSASGR